MVIPAGQSKTENLAVPVGDVTPGAHTIEVLLSAARDESPENNTGIVEINRSGPAVNVEMTSVVVSPDVLILGDQATINATIQKQQRGSPFSNPRTICRRCFRTDSHKKPSTS